jgi:predicted phage-related endonuclease
MVSTALRSSNLPFIPPTTRVVEKPKSREAWLAGREPFIGASESAILLDKSSFKSYYSLWSEKSKITAAPDIDNERMAWGRRLEAPIAEGLAEDFGFEIVEPDFVLQDLDLRAAATLDFYIPKPSGEILKQIPNAVGAGPLEIKNVDSLIAKQKWAGEPDISYLVQLQHQMMLFGANWGAIGALIGGNKGVLFCYEVHEPTVAAIRTAIRAFWKSVDNAIKPEIDGSYSTAETIKSLNPEDDGSVEVVEDAQMEDLCRMYKEFAAQERQAKDEKFKVQNQLRDFLGARKRVEIGDFCVTASTVKKEGFWVNPSSYRNLSVTQRKPKEVQP